MASDNLIRLWIFIYYKRETLNNRKDDCSSMWNLILFPPYLCQWESGPSLVSLLPADSLVTVSFHSPMCRLTVQKQRSATQTKHGTLQSHTKIWGQSILPPYFHNYFLTSFGLNCFSQRKKVASSKWVTPFFFVVEKRHRLALWCKTVNCLRLQHDSKGKLMDLKGQSSAREPWHKRCGHNCLWVK